MLVLISLDLLQKEFRKAKILVQECQIIGRHLEEMDPKCNFSPCVEKDISKKRETIKTNTKLEHHPKNISLNPISVPEFKPV